MMVQYVNSFLLKVEFRTDFNFGTIDGHLILILLVICFLTKEQ